MQDGSAPPRAPVPIIKEVTHYSIELEWGEYLDRLAEVFTREDGRISVEVQIRTEKSDEWELLYAGYARFGVGTSFEPDTKYQARMRFRNKHGPGPFSPIMDITTAKRPLTGIDIHKALRMDDVVNLKKILNLKEANIEAQDDVGFTPLQVAANAGNLQLVEILLEFGANTETPSDAGKTALMCAAYKEQVNILNLLVSHGADLERTDRNGLTAIHAAVDGEKIDSVNTLLKANANVNATDSKLCWTPLHRIAGLKNNGNAKIAEQLVKNGALIDACDRDGKTPLMLAAMNGHDKVVDVLLRNGADLYLKNQQGHTALRLAESNDRRMVKKIIDEYVEKHKQNT